MEEKGEGEREDKYMAKNESKWRLGYGKEQAEKIVGDRES